MSGLLTWRLDQLYDDISPRKLKIANSAIFSNTVVKNNLKNPINSNSNNSNSTVVKTIDDKEKNIMDDSSIDIYTIAGRSVGLTMKDSLYGIENDKLAIQFTPHQCHPYSNLETIPTDIYEMLQYLGRNLCSIFMNILISKH